MMDFLINLKNIDRRYVFIFIAAAVAFPMIFGWSFPVVPGKNVKNIYDFVENLPAQSRIFMSFDYDPGSKPELHPAAVAMMVQMFKKGHKPICGANWPLGGDMAEMAIASASGIFRAQIEKAGQKPKELKSGEDWVNLGYKPGATIHVKRLVADFMGPYPTDINGIPTRDMPIFKMKHGKRFSVKDVGMIISFTAGTGGIESYIDVSGEHGRPMAAGCTSVNIPRFYTYIQTKQLVGMTGGLPGAAEYEALVGHTGAACRGMAPQSIAHLVIMLFIVIGNLAYLAEKAREKKR